MENCDQFTFKYGSQRWFFINVNADFFKNIQLPLLNSLYPIIGLGNVKKSLIVEK